MSRTYRCRHLPPVARWGGAAEKIVDGRGGSGGWSRRRDIIDAIATEMLGPRPATDSKFVKWGESHKSVRKTRKEFRPVGPALKDGLYHWKFVEVPYWDYVKLPGHFIKTWEAFEWDRLRDLIEADYVWPRSEWHPWAKWRNGHKTYHKRRANREMRRKTHQILHSETVDDDWEGNFPRYAEHFNSWDLF